MLKIERFGPGSAVAPSVQAASTTTGRKFSRTFFQAGSMTARRGLAMLLVMLLVLSNSLTVFAQDSGGSATPPKSAASANGGDNNGAVSAGLPAGQAVQTGTFYIISSGLEPLYFFHDDASGKNFNLNVDTKLLEAAGGPNTLNGTKVQLTGAVSPARYPRGGSTEILDVTGIQSANGKNSPPSKAAFTGSQKFANLLCKFSDSATTEPKTPAYFTGLMSNTVGGMDHYFREASYNTINLVGTVVVGWYTLPQPRSYYVYGSPERLDFGRAAGDCTAVADAAVDFTTIAGINLMFNTTLDSYAWGGSWYLPLDGLSKSWPMTWMPPWGYEDQTVLAHEMGHAFGMPHSANQGGTTYGNVWDVMSDTWSTCSRLTNPTYGCLGQQEIAYHKDLPGWLPAARKFNPTGGSQTITLERLAQPGSTGYLMAKIPYGSSGYYYTVEARKNDTGYDVKLPDSAVIIHDVHAGRLDPAWVLGNATSANAKWKPGQTWTDSTNGISVSVDSATTSGFVVTITTPLPAANQFHALPPFRLYDSRSGSAFAAGETRTIAVSGQYGSGSASTVAPVPSGAKAVLVNFTAIGVSKGGFLAAYQTGTALPNVSTLNWYAAGQTVANTAVVPLNASGQMSVYVAASTAHLAVDVIGYYDGSATGPAVPSGSPFSGVISTSGITYHALPSSATSLRLYDSRTGSGGAGPLTPGGSRLVQASGSLGIPATAKAVAVNLTATNAVNNGYLALYPGSTNPGIASVNFNGSLQGTVNNMAIVALDSAGRFTITEGGNAASSSDYVIDVLGYLDGAATTTGGYNLLTPIRLYDSRAAYGGSGPLTGSSNQKTLAVNNRADLIATGVPNTAKNVVVHITAANTVAGGFMTAFGPAYQGTASVNWSGANQLVSNLSIVNIESLNELRVRAGGGSGYSSEFIVDIVGYINN